MDKRDAEKMVLLAREGKAISKIWEEDFPEYDYWDIHTEVHDGGEKSAVGTRRMITNRLNKLADCTSKKERQQIIEEINNNVWHLYNRYRESQKKLDEIRNIING